MKTARLVSIQVGKPREVKAHNGETLTSIFKSPVYGKVALRGYNLYGDQQSDLTVHGGPNKAVYLYPSEHYSYWAEELPDMDLPFGIFGENLTTEGVTEEAMHIGDQLRIGTAVLQVSQPRMPCYKLGIRFSRADMVKRFWNSGRSGIYFSVVKEGEMEAGDGIERLAVHPEHVSVADVVRLYKREIRDPALYERVLRVPLSGSWKEEIRERWTEAFSTA
ncbi:MAG: MOSC domain-containing protein [Acidobacteriaceae bacterium]|nr:MOSC domain-containing protein [Acidobacteriaceae bacterium]MBV9294450.1 MOSC domain-containing protein [Acidobacteriaceae bacterium]MBV9766111.1 MOSC domain-containing protein [Acidobacteriaceae bacterium]